MTGRIEGRRAVVTGASGGIGQAIAARFAKEGAEVVAFDLKGPRDALPQGVEHRELDITDAHAVTSAFARLGAEWPALDILVNAAGIEIEKTIEETTLEEWTLIFAVNVTGTFLVAKNALPMLRRSTAEGGASVVNFGSYDGFIADPGLAAYCATKGAVHALTRAMACDHGPEGIRVNAVCPGYVDTPMLQSFFGGEGSGAGGKSIAELQEAVRGVHPIRRYGRPEDVANLVLWLASAEAAYAAGQLWVLDGGLSAQVQQMRL